MAATLKSKKNTKSILKRQADVEWLNRQKLPKTIQVALTSKIRLGYNEHGLVVVGEPIGYIERLESLYFDSWHHITTRVSIYSQIRHAKIAFRLNELNQRNIRIKSHTKEELNKRIKELHIKAIIIQFLDKYFIAEFSKIVIANFIQKYFVESYKNAAIFL